MSIHGGGNGILESYRLTYNGEATELSVSHREKIMCLPLQETELELAAVNDAGLGNHTTIAIPAASSLDGMDQNLLILIKE